MTIKPARGIQINRADPLANMLLGFWPMNEGDGNILYDYSGRRSHGAIDGAIWAPAGLSFDGTNDFVEITPIPEIDWVTEPGLTYMALTGPMPGGDVYASVVGGWNSSDVSRFSWIGQQRFTPLGRPGILGGRQFNSNAISTQHASAITTEDIQIISTINTTAAKLYIDGVFSAEDTDTDPFGSSDYDKFRLGHNGGTKGGFFGGLIKTVAIWGRVLTNDEIIRISSNPYTLFKRRPPRSLFAPVGVGGIVRQVISAYRAVNA